MAEGDETCEKNRDDKILEEKEMLFRRESATLGSKDEKTLATHYDIASPSLKISPYDQELEKVNEVYNKRSATLGPDHDDTIAAQAELARTYTKHNRLNEAVLVLEEIYKKYYFKFGPNDQKTQDSVKSIGLHLQKLKKYDEAFEIYNKMVDGFDLQYRMAGDLQKGKKYAQKAVEFLHKIHEKVLNTHGPDKEETWTSKCRLGEALVEINDFQKAANIYKEVYIKREKHLKVFLKDTISACRHAGVVSLKAGMVDEGLKYLKKANRRSKVAFGRDDKLTLKIQADLGSALYLAGEYDQALQFYEHIYKIQRIENPDILDTFETAFIIGNILSKQRNHSDAQKVYNEAEENYKGDYMEKTKLKRKLFFSFLKEEKNIDTEGLNTRYAKYKELEKTLGPSHTEALDAYEKITVLSTNYHPLLQVLKDVYTTRKEHLGANDPDTLKTRLHMANVFALNHDYLEALLLYREIYDERNVPPFAILIYNALTNLAAMFCLLGKYEASFSAYAERLGLEISDDQRPATYLNLSLVEHLVKDDMTNDKVLNAFRKLSEETIKTWGHNHRVAIVIQYIIAKILRAQEKYYDALEAFQTIETFLETLSYRPDHILVANIRNNIQDMYELALLSGESYKNLEERYERLKLTLGPEDPECLETQIHLVLAFEKAGKRVETLSHAIDAYEKSRLKLGLGYPLTSEYDFWTLRGFIRAFRSAVPKSMMVEKIDEGDFDSFQAVVRQYPCKINNRDEYGVIPLHYAAKEGRIEYVKFLLEEGAFYDLADQLGERPLDNSLNNEVVILLKKVNSFFDAVKEGTNNSVNEFIEEDRMFLRAVDKGGNNCVHWACEKGHLEIVKILVNNGADPSLKNNEGKTPYDIAINLGHTEIVEFLGHPLGSNEHCSSNDIHDYSGTTALLFAREGQLQRLQELLLFNAGPTL